MLNHWLGNDSLFSSDNCLILEANFRLFNLNLFFYYSNVLCSNGLYHFNRFVSNDSLEVQRYIWGSDYLSCYSFNLSYVLSSYIMDCRSNYWNSLCLINLNSLVESLYLRLLYFNCLSNSNCFIEHSYSWLSDHNGLSKVLNNWRCLNVYLRRYDFNWLYSLALILDIQNWMFNLSSCCGSGYHCACIESYVLLSYRSFHFSGGCCDCFIHISSILNFYGFNNLNSSCLIYLNCLIPLLNDGLYNFNNSCASVSLIYKWHWGFNFDLFFSNSSRSRSSYIWYNNSRLSNVLCFDFCNYYGLIERNRHCNVLKLCFLNDDGLIHNFFSAWLNYWDWLLFFDDNCNIFSDDLRSLNVNSLVDSNCLIEKSHCGLLNYDCLSEVVALILNINFRSNYLNSLSYLSNSLVFDINGRNLDFLCDCWNSRLSKHSLVLLNLWLYYFYDFCCHIVNIRCILSIDGYNQINNLGLGHLCGNVINSDAGLYLFDCCGSNVSLILSFEFRNLDFNWLILKYCDILSGPCSFSSYGCCSSRSSCCSWWSHIAWNDRLNLFYDNSLIEEDCLVLNDRYLSLCDLSLINSNALILSYWLNRLNQSNCLCFSYSDSFVDCFNFRPLNFNLFDNGNCLIYNWYSWFFDHNCLCIIESLILNIYWRHYDLHRFNDACDSLILNVKSWNLNLFCRCWSHSLNCESLVERNYWLYSFWSDSSRCYICYLRSEVSNGLNDFNDLSLSDLRCLVKCFHLGLDDLNDSCWSDSLIASGNAGLHSDLLHRHINWYILMYDWLCGVSRDFLNHNCCLVRWCRTRDNSLLSLCFIDSDCLILPWRTDLLNDRNGLSLCHSDSFIDCLDLRFLYVNLLNNSHCLINDWYCRLSHNNSLSEVEGLVLNINRRYFNFYGFNDVSDGSILDINLRDFNLFGRSWSDSFSCEGLVDWYNGLYDFRSSSSCGNCSGSCACVRAYHWLNYLNHFSVSHLRSLIDCFNLRLYDFNRSCRSHSLILSWYLRNNCNFLDGDVRSDILSWNRDCSISGYLLNDDSGLVKERSWYNDLLCLCLIDSNCLVLSNGSLRLNNSNSLSLCDSNCLIHSLNLRLLDLNLFNNSNSLIDNWHSWFSNNNSLSVVESLIFNIKSWNCNLGGLNDASLSLILKVNLRNFDFFGLSWNDCLGGESLVERNNWFYDFWGGSCGCHSGWSCVNDWLDNLNNFSFSNLGCLIHCLNLRLDYFNCCSWCNSLILSRNTRHNSNFLNSNVLSDVLSNHWNSSIGSSLFNNDCCLVLLWNRNDDLLRLSLVNDDSLVLSHRLNRLYDCNSLGLCGSNCLIDCLYWRFLDLNLFNNSSSEVLNFDIRDWDNNSLSLISCPIACNNLHLFNNSSGSGCLVNRLYNNLRLFNFGFCDFNDGDSSLVSHISNFRCMNFNNLSLNGFLLSINKDRLLISDDFSLSDIDSLIYSMDSRLDNFDSCGSSYSIIKSMHSRSYSYLCLCYILSHVWYHSDIQNLNWFSDLCDICNCGSRCDVLESFNLGYLWLNGDSFFHFNSVIDNWWLYWLSIVVHNLLSCSNSLIFSFSLRSYNINLLSCCNSLGYIAVVNNRLADDHSFGNIGCDSSSGSCGRCSLIDRWLNDLYFSLDIFSLIIDFFLRHYDVYHSFFNNSSSCSHVLCYSWSNVLCNISLNSCLIKSKCLIGSINCLFVGLCLNNLCGSLIFLFDDRLSYFNGRTC